MTTVKSSEVLRLAAEYALSRRQIIPMAKACVELQYPWEKAQVIFGMLLDMGYNKVKYGEETCMLLCLAAAIAESEGH
ncbi:hypothetical protein [Herbaspirillum sp.]|uniref:hypothetical protein n=1 Tax=Herbaspirillum sp. TaxID=1890675 RepID=UPI000C0AF989|nr:hypothetical protein [Herbaspirillum sp.]MAF04410.1 hypothetical protein [Herbaspirillum sp.]|tara:strand:+ start:563 stop:796 length:234 start_codon:yes stop_codon:yes gene_type:complete